VKQSRKEILDLEAGFIMDKSEGFAERYSRPNRNYVKLLTLKSASRHTKNAPWPYLVTT